ncbi:MAG TPA: Gfo/Idh/MocA family oxidoreductase [Tepidisphaeraceae bacterium]|jgi:predicted dehydrogenase
MSVSRRNVLKTTAALTTTALLSSAARTRGADQSTSKPSTKPASTKADRPAFGIIGCGGIARFHSGAARKFGDIVAICDVDQDHLASYQKDFAGGKAWTTNRYQDLLARPDVQLVFICTPDHWHTKIAIDALRAGKDIYCEKPVTLTIDEGRILCRVARETGRVFQVGTQQRSDERFLQAVALAQAGRLGKIRQCTVAIGDTPTGTGFQTSAPPKELDWDQWLGQCPKVPFIKQRCHYDFRWWYEYSGGRMTDWGAHHVDIAQWAIAPDLPGPMLIEPTEVDLPVMYDRGYPTASNAFNTASRFNVKFTFANGAEMFVRDRVPNFPSDNGILIEGDGGWLFVNRETIKGPAYDQLKENPLPDNAIPPLAQGVANSHERHVLNFITCARNRTQPVSDIFSHHKHLTTCHLGNIAMRLGRKLRWDATAQEIIGDAEADTFQSRQQRRGFEIV